MQEFYNLGVDRLFVNDFCSKFKGFDLCVWDVINVNMQDLVLFFQY